VWVMDEIGKEKPITLGVVVDGGAIESLDVLVFRESRGWEIRHPFFTDQFRRLRLGHDGGLDRPVDGITGATLSVRAAKRVATAALILHAHTEAEGRDVADLQRTADPQHRAEPFDAAVPGHHADSSDVTPQRDVTIASDTAHAR